MFFSRKNYVSNVSKFRIPTLNFTVRSKPRHLVNFSATTIEQPIKLRAILISVFCQSKSHTTTCIDSRKPNVLYFVSTGAPRLARPPRPGPCLDFGFQYALIRNNQSKKFGVEYWTLPGSNWPWRPCRKYVV